MGGNQSHDKRGAGRSKSIQADDTDQGKNHENVGNINQVIQRKGIVFIDTEDLKNQADQKRPAAGILVIVKPLRFIFAIFKSAEVAGPRLVDIGNVLSDIGVNVFIIVDSMGADRGLKNQEQRHQKNKDQDHSLCSQCPSPSLFTLECIRALFPQEDIAECV
ncbi:MAG: hypothetical protein A4E72_01311 [Syntrophus sp. PtaU1.Bin208]|nr:MAG: hypothetical protein A4E72_01311 [Syntrophus sp. PtaU1.Bin208]